MLDVSPPPDALHTAQAAAIRALAASLLDYRATIGSALSAAKLGVWECRLKDESLSWTDGVYEMFEVPRGSTLRRGETLNHYASRSLASLESVRSKAIAQGTAFKLDAEIVTARGSSRWIRLTGTVERENGVATRLFGLKQDITEEKLLADRTRRLAEVDSLTGLANRRIFQSRLSELAGDPGPRLLGALMLIDLDGFKQVNDSFGHALGDDCLREAASRLQRVCREAELVARIGGDEFAVLVGAHHDRWAIERLARDIVDALRMEVDGSGRTFGLGASVGVAWAESDAPSELFARADVALYAAKAAGRNTFRTFSTTMPRVSATMGLVREARSSIRATG